MLGYEHNFLIATFLVYGLILIKSEVRLCLNFVVLLLPSGHYRFYILLVITYIRVLVAIPKVISSLSDPYPWLCVFFFVLYP